jgi:hypothetical protein
MEPAPVLPVAVLDANVLYPQFSRDVFMRLAIGRLFHPRWTDQIHAEWTRNVIADYPDIAPARIERVRSFMETAFPYARVTGYRRLEASFPSVHPKDRHVAAAAVKAGATHLLTWNLKDFPADALRPFGIRVETPDDFILRLLRGDHASVLAILEAHRTGLHRPPLTRAEYRETFHRNGMPRSARLLPE